MQSLNEALHSFAKIVGISPLNFWIILGFIGQAMFTARFVVQWIASERKGESVVPVYFWFLSIFGSTTVLIYAIHKRDPVFIAAYGFGNFIYFRNLILIYRKKNRQVNK